MIFLHAAKIKNAPQAFRIERGFNTGGFKITKYQETAMNK
jgi:hypothetical protein